VNAPIRAILLDIEGTIAPLSYVHDVLFPYARAKIPDFVRANWDNAKVRSSAAQLAADAFVDKFDEEGLVRHLFELMDRDVKATGLKVIQGLIWQRGYTAGELRSLLFPDVPPALRRWRERGLILAVYSSGSIAAQRVFLACSEFGDLTPLFSAYFDTTTGPKKSADSYRAIAEHLRFAPQHIAFISDIPDELAAANDAGMVSLLAVRPGNAEVTTSAHPRITSFDEVPDHIRLP